MSIDNINFFQIKLNLLSLSNRSLKIPFGEGKKIKMKTIGQILFFLVIVGGLFSCEKLDVSPGTPHCIIRKIKKIKSSEVRNPPAKVWQYEYKGELVYYIPAYCCDIPSELYDSDCNFICSPDGGITGNGDNKCPDFFNSRTKEVLVWEDSR